MTQPIMRIEQSAIDKVVNFMKKNILSPKLSEISYGIRFHIAQRGFAGAATHQGKYPSVKSTQATTHIISPKKLKSQIKPVVPEVFEINKTGYSGMHPKYTKDDPALADWVLLNYWDMSKKNSILNNEKPLMVRGRTDYGGYSKPPLGDPERDYFGLGLKDFIINKNKYGLS